MYLDFYHRIRVLIECNKKNKFPQVTPCGSDLVTSLSFTSEIPFYNHNFDDEKKCKKKSKGHYFSNFRQRHFAVLYS